MLLKYGLPATAVLCLIMAVYHVVRTSGEPPLLPPPVPPAPAPANVALAATGMVEGQNGNIAVAAPHSGVVAAVLVKAGQHVEAGATLFRLDGRSLQAELRVRAARLVAARAQLARLEQMPRPDETAASAARVGEARAQLAIQQAKLERGQTLFKDKLVSTHELEQLKQAVVAAQEHLAAAQAADRMVRAGAWEADRTVARAAVAEAEALVAQGQAELEKLTVVAPVSAEVLQVNVRVGEAIGNGPTAPVVLGVLGPLRLRVDIPEHLIGRFRSDAPAHAVPRGQAGPMLPLKFDRVELMVVPRRVLTGVTGEQSDARVLPVLYELDPGKELIYVGQQLDVFIGRP
jgi:multidrug efflux pump subunit AcrA (membrane-fusion protein)